MSNLEREPAELVCPPALPQASPARILEPRDVPLGGPRAMGVRRTLPQRGRTTIGAWCFIDHYGPDDVAVTGGMVVPPHPHTGLQTVSWLFEGEVEHRDSVGSHAFVVPGDVNLMTAGHGISHSEISTPETTVLHGVQLWTVLPDASRDVAPFFENATTTPVAVDDATVRVFVGELEGAPPGTVTTFSPLVAAQIDVPEGGEAWIPLDPDFEHGFLVDAGPAHLTFAALEREVDPAGENDDPLSETGHTIDVARNELAFLTTGHEGVRVRATAGPVRLVLVGGTPFEEEIVMWWNFIGRDHDEIVAFRAQWEQDVIAGADPSGRFGAVGDSGDPLPAPVLPGIRLKPRNER
ncbi:pirin family protein [Agromyces seonyuensis]|uniref:Pirin family protein n=1 Tax=Agromyces seonyuensis TaxID=2662446 RepID=A0A6I4P2U7_9MICO|nr:pirin family protein [Agromyces seonyuensis]MWB99085.1 pirin family protein [Agromyces seonyuensis]